MTTKWYTNHDQIPENKVVLSKKHLVKMVVLMFFYEIKIFTKLKFFSYKKNRFL